MRHLIIGSITALFVLVGCGPATGKLNKIKFQTPNNEIVIYTRNNVDSQIYKAVKFSAHLLNRQVFQVRSGCPKVVVSRFLGKMSWPVDGINIYDSVHYAGWPTQNSCEEPSAAISNDGKKASINLCKKRISDAVWSHALDPNVYLIMHNLAKVLGLPTTVGLRGVASYTANELLGSGSMFRFRESEKRALRKRYCR